MAADTRVPEKYDPFLVYDLNSSDYCDKRISSVLLNTSKVNGPLTALIMAGIWEFVYALEKRMLGIFINDLVDYTIKNDKVEQTVADFSCIAYSTAVSKALHNDERKAGKTIFGALWRKLWGGESFFDSISEEREKNYKLIPPMTASIIHVFLLNLNVFDDSFDDEHCAALLEKYDFSDFTKLNKNLDKHLVFCGNRTLPDLLINHKTELKKHISYLRELDCGDYFLGRIDHYEKKESTVPEGYLYGEF